MYLKSIELTGFKSFGKKTELQFGSSIAAIVGPNGSGKSNVAEAFRFVLGEQSMKSMRSKRGEDLIWGGSPALPRMNRASVKVLFDNSSRLLDLDFKEVVVERTVYRDGQNEYLLNGTQVRLKDVIRLLAGIASFRTAVYMIGRSAAGMMLLVLPWAMVLSLHYGEPTFSTSAALNHALVGPHNPDWLHPSSAVYNVPEAGRITTWEDPTLLRNHPLYKPWSPLSSWVTGLSRFSRGFIVSSRILGGC